MHYKIERLVPNLIPDHYICIDMVCYQLNTAVSSFTQELFYAKIHFPMDTLSMISQGNRLPLANYREAPCDFDGVIGNGSCLLCQNSFSVSVWHFIVCIVLKGVVIFCTIMLPKIIIKWPFLFYSPCLHIFSQDFQTTINCWVWLDLQKSFQCLCPFTCIFFLFTNYNCTQNLSDPWTICSPHL